MDRYFTFRISKSWLRTALIAVVTALVTVPVTVLAAGGFDDVPDDNIFQADVEWLQDAGITKGCNPPENTLFCPRDNVTRQQMAAFMRRLAENKVVDASTAVTSQFAIESEHADHADDSGTLDGFAYDELASRANATTFDFSGTDFVDIELSVPATGFLLAMASGDAWGGTGVATCDLTLEGSGMFGGQGYVDHAQYDEADCVTSKFAVVDAGSHVVRLDWDDDAGGNARYEGALWAVWVPFGGDGSLPEPPPPPKAPTDSKSD